MYVLHLFFCKKNYIHIIEVFTTITCNQLHWNTTCSEPMQCGPEYSYLHALPLYFQCNCLQCSLVAMIFHTSTLYPLPIWTTPSSPHSPSSFIHIFFSSFEAWTPHLEVLSLTLHYNRPPVLKVKFKMNFTNGFSSIIDLMKNYRIFQYFLLVICMVLPKLSSCHLQMFII